MFLHGGGVVAGSGSAPLFDGGRLATRGDLVVVTINFRLGALGSLLAPERLGDDGDRATNLALRDQLMALRWVRDEIGAFGGDPADVTVMGQSSGAVAIACMLAGQAAAGALRPGHPAERRPRAGALHRRGPATSPGSSSPRSETTIGFDRLRPTVEEILAAQAHIPTGFVPPEGPFHHAIDGELIPEHPLVAAGRRPLAARAVLAGTTRDEWRAFDAVLADDEVTDELRCGNGSARSRATAARRRRGPRPSTAPSTPVPPPVARRRAVASALVTDFHFGAPTEQFVRAHAAHGNRVHRYELQWPSPRPGSRCLPRHVPAAGVRDDGPRTGARGNGRRRHADVRDGPGRLDRLHPFAGIPRRRRSGRGPRTTRTGGRRCCWVAEPRVAERHRADSSACGRAGTR